MGEDRVDGEGGDLDSKGGFGGGHVDEDASGAESRECAGGGVEEDGADVGFGLWVFWVCGFSVEMLPVLARVQLKTVRASALKVFWVWGRQKWWRRAQSNCNRAARR
ncbi:hypothetical protein ACFX15_034980 [Malus domestica]